MNMKQSTQLPKYLFFAVCFIISFTIPFPPISFIARLIGITGLLALVYSGLLHAGMKIERVNSKEYTFIGDPVTMSLKISNRTPLPCIALEIYDHPGRLFTNNKNRQLLLLKPFETRILKYKTGGPSRGEYTAGPLTVTGGDPLGLFVWQEEIPGKSRIIIYPCKKNSGEMRMPPPGDGPILILLNLSEEDYLLRSRYSSIEKSVSDAAGLVYGSISKERKIGLITNGLVDNREGPLVFNMESGRDHCYNVLTTLTGITSSLEKFNIKGLAELPGVDIPSPCNGLYIGPPLSGEQWQKIESLKKKGITIRPYNGSTYMNLSFKENRAG